MKKQTPLLGSIFIIIAAMMWGIDGILLTPSYFTKFQFFDVNFIVFIAHAIPTIILSIFFSKQYKYLKTFTKSDYLFFILIALFGGTIGTLSLVKALELSNYTPYSIVILIQKTQPIFAILLAIFLLKEKPSKNFYVVAVIALIAIYFLTFEFKSPVLLKQNNLLAVLYSLLAAFSFGSSTVFGKKVVYKFSFLTSTFYRFFFTTIITMLFVIFSETTRNTITQYTQNKNLMGLSLFISIFGLLAILIYYNGLKHVKATIATFCELAFPITSVVTEAIIYKRFLSPIQLVAAIVLVTVILYLNLGNVKIKTNEN